MTNYVLGLDPGGTTGVAMLTYEPDTLPQLMFLHQIPEGHEGFHEFFEGSVPSEYMAIASEKWVEYGVQGADHTPLTVEGVEYALWQKHITWQTPDMKQFIPDGFLKKHNLWTPGKRHQMDALIHALIYLCAVEKHKPTLKALSEWQEEQEGNGSGDGSGGSIAQPGEVDGKQLGEPGEGEGAGAAGISPEQLEAIREAMREAERGMEGFAREVEQAVRKIRELGGVFAGFEPVEDGPSKTLLDD